jgi:hypothetical protein
MLWHTLHEHSIHFPAEPCLSHQALVFNNPRVTDLNQIYSTMVTENAKPTTKPVKAKRKPKKTDKVSSKTKRPATSGSSSSKQEKSKCVRRAYRDFGDIEEQDFLDNHLPTFSRSKRKTAGGVVVPFPEKVHNMLSENTEHSADPSIVSWLPHGRAFKIHKPALFAQESLSEVFQHTKLNSFLRQINLYGFYRIHFGPDKGAYYHELFLRERKFLTRGMARIKVNGRRNVGSKDPTDEPAFYQMSYVGNYSSETCSSPPLPSNSRCSSPPPAVAHHVSSAKVDSYPQSEARHSPPYLLSGEEQGQLQQAYWWYDYEYNCWRQDHSHGHYQACNPIVSPESATGGAHPHAEWDKITREQDLHPPLPPVLSYMRADEDEDEDDHTSISKDVFGEISCLSEDIDPIFVDCSASSTSSTSYHNLVSENEEQEWAKDILQTLCMDFF